MKDEFRASDITKLFNLSSQRLHQFRLVGIVEPSVEKRGQGGTNKYSLTDLIEIGIALKLLKHGVKLTDVSGFTSLFKDLIYEGFWSRHKTDPGKDTKETPWKDITHIYITDDEQASGGLGFIPLKITSQKDINRILKSITTKEDSFIISVEKIRENLKKKIIDVWG